MSNFKDRLINSEDASRIADALEVIAGSYPKVLEKPTLSSNHFIYDGESHNVVDLLVGYDSNKMILSGDVEVSAIGSYKTYITSKAAQDRWTDDSTIIEFDWGISPIDSYPYSWSEASDEAIVSLLSLADSGEIDLSSDLGWSVGDTRTVHLSAMAATGVNETHVEQDVEFVLMHKGLFKDVNGKTVNFIVGTKDCLKENGYMNSSNTNTGGWSNSARRTWCNSIFYNSVPSSIKPIFKQFQVVSIYSPSDGSSNISTSDYFTFPAEKEAYGSKVNSCQVEANVLTQFDYYKDLNNRYKKANGTLVGWWLRSAMYNNGGAFCIINTSTTSGTVSASTSYGIAPIGCI